MTKLMLGTRSVENYVLAFSHELKERQMSHFLKYACDICRATTATDEIYDVTHKLVIKEK